MDEVTSTETSSQEVSNAECPLWQYVTRVKNHPMLVLRKVETHTLSAIIVV